MSEYRCEYYENRKQSYLEALKEAGLREDTVLVNRDGVRLVPDMQDSFPVTFAEDYVTPTEWMIYFHREGGGAYAKASPAEIKHQLTVGGLRRA